jgi:cytochrome oxidase Cu insertion factor (SCO1/SenC/PrrC family)
MRAQVRQGPQITMFISLRHLELISYRYLSPPGAVLSLTTAAQRMSCGSCSTGQFTLLAFVYTRCGDLCPLATMRLSQLRDLADQSFKGKLRLITMSFDPEHDTPEMMARFAEAWRGPEVTGSVPWLFLTAPSPEAIAPLLAAYDQPLAPKVDPKGRSSSIGHLMRVFLIDDRARIRNIYSPDFLDPRLMLNDLLTIDTSSLAAKPKGSGSQGE